MDMLKKFFPLSFQPKADMATLVINILIQLVVGVVIGWVISIVVLIPIVGLIVGLVGGLLDLYILAGIILSCLDYFKILK